MIKAYPQNTFLVTQPLEARFWYTLYGFTAVFKADLIHQFEYTKRPRDFTALNKQQSHDLWIYFLANVLGKISFIPDVLSHYRRHSTAATGGPNAASKAVKPNFIKIFGYKKVDSDYYRELSKIASEYALKLSKLSTETTNNLYASRLLDGKEQTTILSKVMLQRSTIHSRQSNYYEKITAYASNVIAKASSGKISDLAARTMIKDFLAVIGLLR